MRVKTAGYHSHLCALCFFTGDCTDYIALHCEGIEILKKAHSFYQMTFVLFDATKIDKKYVNNVIKHKKMLCLHIFLPCVNCACKEC